MVAIVACGIAPGLHISCHCYVYVYTWYEKVKKLDKLKKLI